MVVLNNAIGAFMKLDKFDENFEMYINISEEKEVVSLTIADYLNVIDELPNLPLEYENRIIEFLESSKIWYANAVSKIKEETNIKNIDCELLIIFILSEPDEKELIFGLEFGLSFDIEHNIGMKIKEKDYSVIEYGTGDVAFC